jgi:O-antigen ligase
MYGTLAEGRLLLQGTLAEDPNLLCSYFLFGIVYSFMVLMGNGNIWKKLIAVLEIFIYAYTILATGSRGGLISVAIAFLIVFVFYKGEYSKGALVKKIIIAFLILIGATMVVTLISDDMLKRYTIASVVESKGTHRLEFWEKGMEIYADSNLFRQIFGYGYNTIRTIFSRNNFISVVMHNVYLEYLMEIGIIGLLIYMNSLIKYIMAGVRKKDFFSLAVICGMMALAVSTNIIAFKPYWNIMIYTICSCTLYKEDVECKNELREMVE